MQKKIDGLKPYVIGIRFTQELTIIDVVLKDNWVMDETTKVKIGKSEDSPNYYMVYSDDGEMSIDQMLDFVGVVINQNIEREKKVILLNEKIFELEKLFEGKSLEELLTLSFSFNGKTKLIESKNDVETNKYEIPSDVKIPLPSKVVKPMPTVDEKVQEEKYVEHKIESKINDLGFELPPKGVKIEVETFEAKSSVCKCKTGEMCEICLDM